MADMRWNGKYIGVLRRGRKKLRSSAEGTQAISGQVVHAGSRAATSSLGLTDEELAILERRGPRLQRRLDEIAARSQRSPQVRQVSEVTRPVDLQSSAVETAPVPVTARPRAGDGQPAPMCKHCGGLTEFDSRVTWCGAVETAEERWRCLRDGCPGTKDVATRAFPLREYERRG